MRSFLRVTVVSLLLVLTPCLAHSITGVADKQNKTTEAVPLLVRFEFWAWTKPNGTDMPDFVLYEDGTVIYNDCQDGACFRYVTVKLTTAEIDEILNNIGAKEFESYKDLYSNSDDHAVSDLPSPFLMLRRKTGSYKRISTYGMLSNKAAPENRVQDIPPTLVGAFRFLWDYTHPKAVGWAPKFIEVIVWPYDGDSKKRVKWDRGLPDINDANSIAFGMNEEKIYSIMIPESLEKKFAHTYWKWRRSKGAILMNGKRWDLTYRFPFPSERVWMADSDGKMFRDRH